MLEAATRRTVLGQLAAFPVVGGAGALIVCPGTTYASTLAKIDAAARRYAEAKQTFEAALAAYTASAPAPHWSINYADRGNALCRRWAYHRIRFEAGPKYLPDDRCLDDDYNDFWKANRDDREVCASYARLTRRLKARTKRYQQRLEAHIERYRLDDLQADQTEAESSIFNLAKAVFEKPAKTMDDVRLQARMLQSFSATLSDVHGWPTYQAGLFGRQLADSLCKLDLAA